MKQAESCEKSLDGRRGVNWIYERKDSGTNGGRVAKRGPETLEGVEWKAESRGACAREEECRARAAVRRAAVRRAASTNKSDEGKETTGSLSVCVHRERPLDMLRDEVEG